MEPREISADARERLTAVIGVRLPALTLSATVGPPVDLSVLPGASVVFCYPWTGRPGLPNPPDWDVIPGAHGSTPPALGFSKLYPEFMKWNLKVFGLSLQDTAYQQEFALRCRLPFALLGDEAGAFSHALALPWFETGGVRYLKRLTLIARDGVIERVRFPIPVPEHDAQDVLHLLGLRGICGPSIAGQH